MFEDKIIQKYFLYSFASLLCDDDTEAYDQIIDELDNIWKSLSVEQITFCRNFTTEANKIARNI